jgi:hypothetical protein
MPPEMISPLRTAETDAGNARRELMLRLSRGAMLRRGLMGDNRAPRVRYADRLEAANDQRACLPVASSTRRESCIVR